VLSAVPRCRGSGVASAATSSSRRLTVEGNRRVQEAVILGPREIRHGAPFNPAQLSEDVRAVFALGFFDGRAS